KTFFVDGLKAQFPDSRVFKLDIGGLLANGGQSVDPEKLRSLFSELDKIGQKERVILVIDEIHRITGIGQGQNSLAEQLKIPLNNPNVRVVGLTTKKEYDMYIAGDEALVRRFHPLYFDPLTKNDILTILRGEANKIMNEVRQDGLKIQVTAEALELIAERASEFIPRRNAPDVHVDVLDAAKAMLIRQIKNGSKETIQKRTELVHIKEEIKFFENQLSFNPDDVDSKKQLATLEKQKLEIENQLRQGGQPVTDVETQLNEVRAEIEKQQRSQSVERFQKILELKNQESQLVEKMKSQDLQVKSTVAKNGVLTVGKTEVAQAISSFTGNAFPIDVILGTDSERIKGYKDYVSKNVIGHERAKQIISDTLKIENANIQKKAPHQGVYLLDGASGNGKSTLAEKTAEALGRQFERVYMTDYRNAADVWKAIGSSLGYVGNEKGGRITNIIGENPRLVFELAEFDKASTEVKDLFYQAFEHGFIEDGRGRRISTKHVMFFLTVNTSADYLAMKKGSELRLNFEIQTLSRAGVAEEDVKRMSEVERTQQTMEQLQVEKGISQALQGRLTANMATDALNYEQAKDVAKIMLDNTFTKHLLIKDSVELHFSKALIEEIAKYGYDPKYGGRSLRELMRDGVAKALADLKSNHGDFQKGDILNIDIRVENFGSTDRLEFIAERNGNSSERAISQVDQAVKYAIEEQAKTSRAAVAESNGQIGKPRGESTKERVKFELAKPGRKGK
ncbi:MAG: ATP-dependent Clp protease ATP-binding subunit, partial [Bdellovibrionales bacterium]|nr:ATP-dependent Clp protease ATP-binding subunit [Bdellovibrionales bacterium]